MINNNNNNFRTKLKKAAFVGFTAISALSLGCTKGVTEQNSNNTQIEITQTDEENKEEKITLNQLYEELESDRKNFVPKNITI